MSNYNDRTTARIPLVPEPIAAQYENVVARLPQVRAPKRRPTADRDLPAVGSFNG